jgi:hypothetical protein
MEVAMGFPWSIILESAQWQYLLTSESVDPSCLSITPFMPLATHEFISDWGYAMEGSACITPRSDKPTKVLKLNVIVKELKLI